MKKGLGCLLNGIILGGCFYGGWCAHEHVSYSDIKVIYVQVGQSEKTGDRALSRPFELYTTEQNLNSDRIFCKGNDNYDYLLRPNIHELKLVIEPLMPPDS